MLNGASATCTGGGFTTKAHTASTVALMKPEHDVGLAPSEALNQGRADRCDEQRAASDAGDRDAERGVAPTQEPSADHRDRRHVSACDADTDADAIGEICRPRDWWMSDVISRPMPIAIAPMMMTGRGPIAIGEVSAGPAERAPYEYGGGEDRGGGAGAGAEFARHRFEEGAEAVGDSVDGEERDERDGDHQPRRRGIELRDGGLKFGLGGCAVGELMRRS